MASSNPIPIDGAATPGEAGDPQPLARRERWLVRLIGPSIAIAVLISVVFQFRKLHFGTVVAMIPTSPLFWIVFMIGYMIGPISDFIIFRYLWKIPASGLVALLRKQVGNELVLGYIGEVYFYDWARKHAHLSTSPFGAVKDVAILSALVGNVMTLTMVALSWHILNDFSFGMQLRTVMLSVGFMAFVSVAAMLFRKRLFSLTGPQLRVISGIHLIRSIVALGLTALTWHLALPNTALVWWVMAATISLMVSRLPFLPNKDLVLAGILIFLVGHDVEVPALMTMMASLFLVTHMIFGSVLMLAEVARTERQT